jgi:superfamily II DNA or RNA helicase
MDYIPAFVANGFYKNRTEFLRTHVVYNNFTKFPKVDHYVEISKLERYKQQILVNMPYLKPAIKHYFNLMANYDKLNFHRVMLDRWNPFEKKPIKDIGEFCHLMRKVVNLDPSRVELIKELLSKHKKIIVFYNFNYELDLLRKLKGDSKVVVAEYNGHKHEAIPKSESWIYLVQYTSGAEGWNCIETNVIVFYSLNYSYRMMTQAAGRIDRLNTPFSELYYYTITTNTAIDLAITKALKNKKDFNESIFGKIS